jgi:adenosylmethionine-8-amino-7-oxononanoate aminotransferase
MTAPPRTASPHRNESPFLHGFSHLPTLRERGATVIERGEGIYVIDSEGRRYIEGNSALWNTVLGFDNRRLRDAALRQYDRLPAYHAFFGRVPDTAVALAERLRAIAPMPTAKVFFTNSGSEANDTAVKILWMIARGEGHPHKRKIISRVNAYHGVTVMTASLTGKDYVGAFGLPLPEVLFAECPHFWRNARPDESEDDYSARLAADLDALIRAEGAETIAGFFAEPVMGAGGVIVPPHGYFPAIQEVLRRHAIPLVADEVICGFGRTGQLWGSETFEMKPDILVASKCITAGYFPMGAVLLTPEMARRLDEAAAAYDEFPHGFTTGAHPVGAAIALEAIEILIEGGVARRVPALAPRFQEGLRRLAAHPLVGEARGIGLMGALDIVADKRAKTAFPAELEVSERIAETALRHGLIIRPLGTSVVLAPPFIIEEHEIDEILAIVGRTLDEVAREVDRESRAPSA